MTLQTRLSLVMLDHVRTINQGNTVNVEIEFRPMSFLAKLAYIIALVFLPVIMLTACNPLSSEGQDSDPVKVETATPEKACIEAFPVVPDTIIKGLENWTLKVSGYDPNSRSRCHWDEDYDLVVCKGRYSDTTWSIDRYCPATLKARAELGGN